MPGRPTTPPNDGTKVRPRTAGRMDTKSPVPKAISPLENTLTPGTEGLLWKPASEPCDPVTGAREP